jgi:hypothetical protein
VWAKECFKLMFGNATDSMLFEDEANTGMIIVMVVMMMIMMIMMIMMMIAMVLLACLSSFNYNFN